MNKLWGKFEYIAAAVLAIGLMGAPASHAQQEIGEIARLQCAALIHRTGVAQPIQVQEGSSVHLKDRITTEEKSRLRIKLKDGSILTLGPKGELSLDDFEFQPENQHRNALFTMGVGKLRVFANDLEGYKKKQFSIKTPTAVCGVRGTLFLVWVEGVITKVVAFDNPIQVSNVMDPSRYITLTKGNLTQVARNVLPSTPVLVTEEQFREFQRELGETDTTTTETPIPDATTTEATTTGATTTTEPTTTSTTSTTPTTTTTSTSTTTTTSTTTQPTTTEATTTSTTTTSTTTTSTTTTSTSTTTTTTLPPLPKPPGRPMRSR